MIDRNKSSILFIVPDQGTRHCLDEILSKTGFVLHFAISAQEGLQKASELIPSIIVLDSNLAEDSFETCRHLRAKKILEGIPLVMLVDREQRDTRALALSAGADDFIDKPIDGLQILTRLRSLTRFNRERYLISDLTRFSWMAEHAHEGYLMLDKSGVIHYANPRALHLLNMPENFIGLPFQNVVNQQYLPEPIETWNNWLNDPSACFLVQPESPTARAVWVVLEALDSPPGVEYNRIVRLRDVTDHMSIHQDMRRFHTVVAHKLRTPMAMLMISVTIIKNQLDKLTPDEIKNVLGSAIKGVDRLADEIRHILTFIDAPLALNLGKPMALVELPQIVKNTCENLRINLIEFSLPKILQTTTISITQDAFEMIIHELLENARKFHPTHQPHIEISIGQTEPGYIRLRFTDDGLTLSPEQLHWAWLPYFQGEKEFTGELLGLGLGFPMVATMIWKAGGTIHLRNRHDTPGVIVDLRIPTESTMRNLERSAIPYAG